MTTIPTPPALVAPTSDDVAALLRARTKDLNGSELGVFNADTRPTDTEVGRLIDMAYAEVVAQVGSIVYDPCAQSATALVALRAAMWVELSYFPEQVRSDRSVYAELATQWAEQMPAVQACVTGNLPGGGGATNVGFRFGVLDVHGWTASPYYGAPEVPPGG